MWKKYNDSLSASLSLKKQQNKTDWTNMDNQCTMCFFARVKQRRAMTHIYRIHDDERSMHEGKDEVALVLVKYF